MPDALQDLGRLVQSLAHPLNKSVIERNAFTFRSGLHILRIQIYRTRPQDTANIIKHDVAAPVNRTWGTAQKTIDLLHSQSTQCVKAASVQEGLRFATEKSIQCSIEGTHIGVVTQVAEWAVNARASVILSLIHI